MVEPRRAQAAAAGDQIFSVAQHHFLLQEVVEEARMILQVLVVLEEEVQG